MHGDKVSYPTAEVELKLGRWSQTTRVVVAPDIPVPVLLGTDIYDLTSSNPVMVTTRAQARRKGNTTAGPERILEEENGLADERSQLSLEEEAVEQRREEAPTLTP